MAWKQPWQRIHLYSQIKSETEIEAKIKVKKLVKKFKVGL